MGRELLLYVSLSPGAVMEESNVPNSKLRLPERIGDSTKKDAGVNVQNGVVGRKSANKILATGDVEI